MYLYFSACHTHAHTHVSIMVRNHIENSCSAYSDTCYDQPAVLLYSPAVLELIVQHQPLSRKQKLPSLDDDAEDEAYFRPRMEQLGSCDYCHCQIISIITMLENSLLPSES